MRRMFSEKQLNEKYVKIIPAPKSATLTDEEMELITKGVFIEGIFLNYVNPVFFPSTLSSGTYYGMVITSTDGLPFIRSYIINASTKEITLQTNFQRRIYLRNIADINGKPLPTDPSNTGTFTLKMVDGNLAWVEDD